MNAMKPIACAGLIVLTALASLAAPEPAPASPAPAAPAPSSPAPKPLPDFTAVTKSIEAIRGATFKKPVAMEKQSVADFRRYIDKDLDADLPAARAGCLSRAFARMRLLPERFDLRKGFATLLASQVAAYYDPTVQTFYIVHPDLPEALLGPTVTHELTHALQDQRFNLGERLRVLARSQNDDAQNAFRFLAEGEASYVMSLATLRDMGMSITPDSAMLDTSMAMGANLGRDGLLAQIDASKEWLDPEARAAIATIANYPDYMLRVLLDPYLSGEFAVHRVRRAGGWSAVDALWKHPPTSTEPFLHPELLGKGGSALPVPVAVPDLSAALGAGYASACENTLGEMETEILLEQVLPGGASAGCAGGSSCVARARAAAAGWGGDRLRAFEANGAGTIVVWRTVWDTDEDAAEFAAAITQSASAWTGSGQPAPAQARRDKEVALVFGATPEQGRALLAALAPRPE